MSETFGEHPSDNEITILTGDNDLGLSRTFIAPEKIPPEPEDTFPENFVTPVPSIIGSLVIIAPLENNEAIPSFDESLEGDAEVLTTHLKDENSELRISAFTDELTGLPNKRALYAGLKAVSAGERVGDTDNSVLMIDLDHFKEVNDTLGHEAGNKVLREVGRRIQAILREDDFAARYGGEEFVVALANTPPENCLALVEKLYKVLAEPSEQWQEPIPASIGIALLPKRASHSQIEAAIKNADEAMYAVKHSGRNNAAIYGQTGRMFS